MGSFLGGGKKVLRMGLQKARFEDPVLFQAISIGLGTCKMFTD